MSEAIQTEDLFGFATIREAEAACDAAVRISAVLAMPMGFGKYKGWQIVDVPLRYLDQTISDMGSTTFVRAVRMMLDELFYMLAANPLVNSQWPDKSLREYAPKVIATLNRMNQPSERQRLERLRIGTA